MWQKIFYFILRRSALYQSSLFVLIYLFCPFKNKSKSNLESKFDKVVDDTLYKRKGEDFDGEFRKS